MREGCHRALVNLFPAVALAHDEPIGIPGVGAEVDVLISLTIYRRVGEKVTVPV